MAGGGGLPVSEQVSLGRRLPSPVRATAEGASRLVKDVEEARVVIPRRTAQRGRVAHRDLRHLGPAEHDIGTSGVGHKASVPLGVGTHEGCKDDVRLSPLGSIHSLDGYTEEQQCVCSRVFVGIGGMQLQGQPDESDLPSVSRENADREAATKPSRAVLNQNLKDDVGLREVGQRGIDGGLCPWNMNEQRGSHHMARQRSRVVRGEAGACGPREDKVRQGLWCLAGRRGSGKAGWAGPLRWLESV